MPDRSRPSLVMRGKCEVAAADASAPQSPRTFRMVANTGEPMRIWPYDLPVVVDLETIDTSGLPVPALYDHCPDIDYAVGQVTAAGVENGVFVASGKFTVSASPGERDYARKVLEKADAGYAWQTSIGGDPKTVEEVKAGQSVTVNGRTYPGPVCVARGVVLREISFVVLGGDRRTSAVVARHRRRLNGSAAMSFEEWLLSMGFDDPAAITEIQRANLQKLYDEEVGEPVEESAGEPVEESADAQEAMPEEEKVAAGGTEEDPLPSNAAARRPGLTAAQAVAAERARVAAITRLCADHGNPNVQAGGKKAPLLTHALVAGWSADRVKTELLRVKRADRPQGPAIVSRSHDRDCSLQALQGAFMLRAGARLDHPAYQTPRALFLNIPGWLRAGLNDAGRNQIMEAAHRYADMSAVDLCREACRLDGKTPGHGRAETIRAAFSGGALANIFTTNVNAVLLTSYMEAPDTTVGWCAEMDVADFKTQERPRVEVGPGLAKLPRGGTADHAAYEDTAESYKVARYAKQFVVDEQDIIDDMLGALSDIPAKFGAAAARLRPDLVYSILLSNPTLADSVALFSAAATRGNLGTSSALQASTLKTAIAAMQNIQENSVNLNLTPTHLIVPPSLKFTAKELVSSAEIIIARGGTTDTTVERGSRNVLTDENLTIVSDSRLENGVTDPASGTANAGSATTWFMASTLAHTIEVGYLRGTGRAPRVRSGQLDKGQYGMWWDVSMDIGAKALDWKGLRKTTA